MVETRLPFNPNSYFAGFITGLFIQWTNIVPVLGAFVLGISIQNLPEVIDIKKIPTSIMDVVNLLIFTKTAPPEVEESNGKIMVHAIKKK